MPNKHIVLPQDLKKLYRTYKRGELEAVNLIKQKITGKIKGRMCADGSKQKNYLKGGEDFAS